MLNADDRAEFSRLNEAVGRAAKAAAAILEGGLALRTIRERQLYRHVAPTWEAYLALHGLTRRRADQLVAAAGVLQAVEAAAAGSGTAVPDLSERAVRPLVGLAPDDVAEAVAEAASSPDGITPATIRQAAGRRRKGKAAKAAKPVRFRVPGWTIVAVPNRKAGPVRDALEAAIRQADDGDQAAGAAA